MQGSPPFLVVCSGSPPPRQRVGHGASYFCPKQPLIWALLPSPSSAAPYPPAATSRGGGGGGSRSSPESPVVPDRLGEVDGLFIPIHHDARHQLLQHHRAHHGYHADVLPAGHAPHQPQARECPATPCRTPRQGPGQGGWLLLCTVGELCLHDPHSPRCCAPAQQAQGRPSPSPTSF